MTLFSFVDLLDRPRRSGRNYLSRCPGHADRSPSLSIAEGDDGRILLKCWAGCTAEEITEAMGLSLKDLFPDERPDRDEIRRAKRKRETAKRVENVGSHRAAVFRKAERVIEGATGIDISSWTEEQLDAAMNRVADAHIILEKERSQDGVI